MQRRYTNATIIGTLLGVCFSSAAWAGEATKPPGDRESRAAAVRGAIAAHLFERMDANKDGQVMRQEGLVAGQQLFQRLDGNADGEVTKTESEAGAKAIREQEVSARFSQLDTDKDGKLSTSEAQLPPGVFERLDTNKDKSIALAELQAGPATRVEHRDFQFAQADANHDGKVTREEGDKASGQRFDQIDSNHDGSLTKAELEAHVGQMMPPAGAKPPAGTQPPAGAR